MLVDIELEPRDDEILIDNDKERLEKMLEFDDNLLKFN
jgi:hypothetical protein